MDFEEHEDQDEEIGMQLTPSNYDSMIRPRIGGSGEGVPMVAPAAGARKMGGYRYKECLKNHAVGIGGSAVDGCGEFMAAGEEGTLDALKCAACNCHRNFHRKEIQGEGILALQQQQQQHHQLTSSYYHRPAGYLHVTPMSQQRPLALASNSRELEMDEDMSNPSSSGGGGSGGGGGGSSSRKRFRTKFTADQKERMLELAERLGWRIQKQDEAVVQNFCAETGLKRHVLKVWMHNNKHTLGKKLP